MRQIKKVNYKVAMTCGGCSKAINTLVAKVPGVQKVDANHESKLVRVTLSGDADADAVTAAIKKTGKAILEGPSSAPLEAN